MATPVKKAENMKKHMTIAEREKREQAEQELERRFVRLIAPKRVKEDPAASAYWKRPRKPSTERSNECLKATMRTTNIRRR